MQAAIFYQRYYSSVHVVHYNHKLVNAYKDQNIPSECLQISFSYIWEMNYRKVHSFRQYFVD